MLQVQPALKRQKKKVNPFTQILPSIVHRSKLPPSLGKQSHNETQGNLQPVSAWTDGSQEPLVRPPLYSVTAAIINNAYLFIRLSKTNCLSHINSKNQFLSKCPGTDVCCQADLSARLARFRALTVIMPFLEPFPNFLCSLSKTFPWDLLYIESIQ